MERVRHEWDTEEYGGVTTLAVESDGMTPPRMSFRDADDPRGRWRPTAGDAVALAREILRLIVRVRDGLLVQAHQVAALERADARIAALEEENLQLRHRAEAAELRAVINADALKAETRPASFDTGEAA